MVTDQLTPADYRDRMTPPDGWVLTGQVTVTRLAGSYVLQYGRERMSRTHGTGDTRAAEDAATRHGFRLSAWHHTVMRPHGTDPATGALIAETVATAYLFDRDWSRCPA